MADFLVTYKNAIPHCFEEKSDAAPKRDKPIKAIVGAMVRGPINLRIIPMIPLKPITTWKSADTIMAPCI